MFCPSCGAKSGNEDRFCHNCGTAVSTQPDGITSEPQNAQTAPSTETQTALKPEARKRILIFNILAWTCSAAYIVSFIYTIVVSFLSIKAITEAFSGYPGIEQVYTQIGTQMAIRGGLCLISAILCALGAKFKRCGWLIPVFFTGLLPMALLGIFIGGDFGKKALGFNLFPVLFCLLGIAALIAMIALLVKINHGKVSQATALENQ